MAAALLGAASPHARAQCQYTTQRIRFPVECVPFGNVFTQGNAINNLGHVVGIYFCTPLEFTNHAFYWTPEEGYVAFEPPFDWTDIWPTDINDHGVICGRIGVPEGDLGFVYDSTTHEWTLLGPAVEGDGVCRAEAINNDGVVVGDRSITEDDLPRNAFIWTAEDGFTDLGVLNGPRSFGTDINDAGVVVGWTGNQSSGNAYVATDSARSISILLHVPGGTSSQAISVSEGANPVVGVVGRIPMKGFPVGVTRGFIWQDGSFTSLGVLPDHAHSAPQAVRNWSLQVVGRSWGSGISHGFLWFDGQLWNLEDLVPGFEWPIINASDINDSGQILAQATQIPSGTGETEAYILTPIVSSPADTDGDCDTDRFDLIYLLEHWGVTDSAADDAADFDRNGVVNVSDLLFCLARWTG